MDYSQGTHHNFHVLLVSKSVFKTMQAPAFDWCMSGFLKLLCLWCVCLSPAQRHISNKTKHFSYKINWEHLKKEDLQIYSKNFGLKLYTLLLVIGDTVQVLM